MEPQTIHLHGEVNELRRLADMLLRDQDVSVMQFGLQVAVQIHARVVAATEQRHEGTGRVISRSVIRLGDPI